MLRPQLEKKIRNSWLDPRKATNENDLFYQYVVAWASANAADEILKMVDTYVERVKSLMALKDKEEPYRIGQ